MEGRGSESGVCVPGWAVERGREEGVVEDSVRATGQEEQEGHLAGYARMRGAMRGTSGAGLHFFHFFNKLLCGAALGGRHYFGDKTREAFWSGGIA